jgi:hypothetical protein
MYLILWHECSDLQWLVVGGLFNVHFFSPFFGIWWFCHQFHAMVLKTVTCIYLQQIPHYLACMANGIISYLHEKNSQQPSRKSKGQVFSLVLVRASSRQHSGLIDERFAYIYSNAITNWSCLCEGRQWVVLLVAAGRTTMWQVKYTHLKCVWATIKICKCS